MTDEDMEMYRTHLSRWRTPGYKAPTPDQKTMTCRILRRVLVISPDKEQTAFICGLFPTAEIISLTYPSIDLSKPLTGFDRRFDMGFVANTLMCTKSPGDWINNMLDVCDEVWVQELIRAWRNGDRELSPETGDLGRFTFLKRKELARVDDAYDLETDNRFNIEQLEFYNGTPDPTGNDCRKFIALVKRRKHETP